MQTTQIVYRNGEFYSYSSGVLKAVSDIPLPCATLVPKGTVIASTSGPMILDSETAMFNISDVLEGVPAKELIMRLIRYFWRSDVPVVIGVENLFMLSSHCERYVHDTEILLKKYEYMTKPGSVMIRYSDGLVYVYRFGRPLRALNAPPDDVAYPESILNYVELSDYEILTSDSKILGMKYGLEYEEGVFDLYLSEVDGVWFVQLEHTKDKITVRASTVTVYPSYSKEDLLDSLSEYIA